MKPSTVSSTSTLFTALALSGASLIACQTQPDRHLGDSLDDRSLDLSPPTTPTEPFGVSPLDFVGRWVGVAEDPLALGGEREAYAFPSGSSEFRLEISPPEELVLGSLRGTLVFGSGPPPPPPVDPGVGYPLGVDYSDLNYFERDAVAASLYDGPLPPYEGYTYSVQESFLRYGGGVDSAGAPLVADGVLSLEFDTGELLAPWCELQQPQPTGYGESSCVKGNTLWTDEDGQCLVGFTDLSPAEEAMVVAQGVSLEQEPVDCNKMILCQSRQCDCHEGGCSYLPFGEPLSVGRLLLRREGDTLTGIFSNTAFMNERQLPVPLGTLRFTRVAD